MAKIPSEFVPLDVNMPRDAAIRAAGPMPELLFVRGLMYARSAKKGGFIPDFDLPVVGVGITALRKHAAALVREGLWIETDGGWLIRSWEKWNPASTERVRARQRSGGSVGNHRRWHAERGVVADDCDHCKASVGDRSTDRSTESVSDRSPSVEVEREREKRETDAPVGTYRGDERGSGHELETVSPDTIFPRGWSPQNRHKAYALEHSLDLAHEARMFAEHARANGRTAVDWDAAFMTWLGKAKPRGRPGDATGTTRARQTLALAAQYEAQEGADRDQITDRPAAR